MTASQIICLTITAINRHICYLTSLEKLAGINFIKKWKRRCFGAVNNGSELSARRLNEDVCDSAEGRRYILPAYLNIVLAIVVSISGPLRSMANGLDHTVALNGSGQEELAVGTGGEKLINDSYPVPSVAYRPQLPPLGKYSIAGVCESIHGPDAPRVVLGDREPLQQAYERLRELSVNRGGVIEIPWDTELIQCDDMRTGRNKRVDSLTVRGIPGPNGELPRFYCRRDQRQGTIPKKGRVEAAFRFSVNTVLIENIHIDGYQGSLKLPRIGKVVVRNNYMHHALSNGLVFSNTDDPGRLNLEICGNEISHSGRGNAEHGLYLHRNISGSGSAEVTFVDNLCHSTPYSSCYKSIANKNIIVNNRFYQSLDTDDSYTKQYSSMLVDISSCAENLIEGNVFHGHKPEATSFGDILIGIRNRKRVVRGCDQPDYDSKEFWDPHYWKSLNGKVVFPTYIKNNTFYAGPEFGDRLYAITAFGTYPNVPLRSFGPARLLPAPDEWYERSRVIVSGNTYIGISRDKAYRSMPPSHCSRPECGPPPARLPDRDLIEVGPGEIFR